MCQSRWRYCTGRRTVSSRQIQSRIPQSSLQNTLSLYQKQCNRDDRAYLLSRLKNHLGELKDIVVGKVLLEK